MVRVRTSTVSMVLLCNPLGLAIFAALVPLYVMWLYIQAEMSEKPRKTQETLKPSDEWTTRGETKVEPPVAVDAGIFGSVELAPLWPDEVKNSLEPVAAPLSAQTAEQKVARTKPAKKKSGAAKAKTPTPRRTTTRRSKKDAT